jgi:WD40 repeat protein
MAQKPPQDLLELLHDTERFLLEFYDPISASALHIYHSALPFSPRRTLLYRTFSYELLGAPILVRGERETGWDPCLRTMEGHSGVVRSIAISQDGTRIISGSDDKTIRIWDAQTGTALCKLEGHSDVVASVAISNDGTHVISGSHDTTVRIWDI